MLIRDKGGSTLFTSIFCWVRRFPKVLWKRDLEMREWVLDTASLITFVGGSAS
jgi:hypothetical protein